MVNFVEEGRVGDKVSDYRIGNGVITDIRPNATYAIKVDFEGRFGTYTPDGRGLQRYKQASLMFANGSVTIDQGTPPSRETEKLHCGLTEAQWQWVIDGEFLVCFSDKSIEEAKSNAWIAALNERMKGKGVAYPFAEENTVWRYVAIPKIKGIRKPHFGGACPTTHEGAITFKLRKGGWVNIPIAKDVDWWPLWTWHKGEESDNDIMEYVELS